MSENIYGKIGKIAISLVVIAAVIWGIRVYYVTASASPTGIYHCQFPEGDDYYFDMYISFDSSNPEKKICTHYYVLNYIGENESIPQAYAKMTGTFTGHEINRAFALFCYDPVERNYFTFPLSKTPVHIFWDKREFNGFDIYGENVSPKDFDIMTDAGNDIILFGKNDLIFADYLFEKVSELPSEYQFNFSSMDY